MQRQRRGRGGRGRGGQGQHSWQKKMLTKLIKDGNATFTIRDVKPFLEGMQLFESKADLLMLLADDRNYGIQRIQECLSFISDAESVDTIVVPILTNTILNSATSRPLYRTPRDNVARGVFQTPGLLEFLSTDWVRQMDQSFEHTISTVAEFLLVVVMASVEARNCDHVKTIATELRKISQMESKTVHQLCTIIHLDSKHTHETKGSATKAPHKVLCWGSDLKPPGGRHDNDHANYRDIQLVPTQEELAFDGMPFLPLSSGDNAVIGDAEESLLDRNFRLLREDAVGTLRENIANPRASKLWMNSRIIGVSCKDAFNAKRTSTLYFLVQFDLPQQRKVNWNVSRAMPRDGLVALQKDGLDPMMATIFIRSNKEKDLWLNSPYGPVVGLIFHHARDFSRALNDVSVNLSITKDFERKAEMLKKASDPNKQAKLEEELMLLKGRFISYTMTEASDSFFSYRPVLDALKSMISIPLAQDIVHLRPTKERPSYLPRHVSMPSDFGSFVCDLDRWSNDDIVDSTTLDNSQAKALHLALTSRVSLVQGPPGTGKTFIGGLVAQIIRDNSDESILCVCYTNHALDQFLTHMLKRGETHLVRIGGRTKSEDLKRYELKELARTKERTTNDATQRMRSVVAKLHRCNDEMNELLETIENPMEWHDLEELFYRIDGRLAVNFRVDAFEDDFQVVGKGNRLMDSDALFNKWRNGEACPLWLDEILQVENDDFQNVWVLNLDDRSRLLNEWKQEYLRENIDALQEMAEYYQELSREKDMISSEIDSRILNDARIIGATTTGAAKYRDLLSIKSAGVVIVEEAGEVLEPHVLSALSESIANSKETKHLILIGDHLQLRPKVENYRLTKVSGHGYDFDVSLFERMIMNGYPSAMLQVQHRMRPCISALIRQQTYPSLQDHKSVHKYPDVKGVTGNLFFVNHNYPEEGADDLDATTKSNKQEASFCVEIVRYLLLQGYKHHQITILTPYVGQILVVLRELRKLGNVSAYVSELDQMDLLEEEDDVDESEMNSSDDKSIRCASIDNFQGEESDIVLVSLVRSNKRGVIGFMKEEQRVNVLLSRAKHGMFIVGNVATLQSSQKGQHVWRPILKMLRDKGRILEGLPTICQIHTNDIVLCKEANDFQKYRPNGGCTRACGARLECGHTCPLTCHPTDTNHILTHKQCVKPCRRVPKECQFNHLCQKLCNEECGPCTMQVQDTKLVCGHVVVAPTCHSVRNSDAIIDLSSECKELVKFTFNCGHICMTTCGNSRSKHPICEAKCGQILDCGHPCQNRCGTCEKRHNCKQKCERMLMCGHICGRSCHGSTKCAECKHPCVVTCIHSKCRKPCKDVCSPCVEECDWQCEHQGMCRMVCGAPCDRLPCGKRCTKLLDCGHQCPSVCGEECPTSLNCVICCTNEKKKQQVDMILFTEYQDLDLNEDPAIFLPCGHFYSMSTLDGVMQLGAAYHQDNSGDYLGVKSLSDMIDTKPKSCPDCRSVIHSVKRYGRLISFNCLRASERKHMMGVDMKLRVLRDRARQESVSHEQLNKLLDRLKILEHDIQQGPMLKVFQACGGGAGIDAPSPPSAPFLQFLRLKGYVYGKLVEKYSDKSYTSSINTYTQAIEFAEESQSKRQGGKIILDKTRLVLQWSEYSDSTKQELLNDMKWIMVNLENIDKEIVNEAKELYSLVLNKFDPKKQIKEVMKAMNVVEGYDYGGSWSDHWFECPNGHPYFIGECGGAMQESRCIECGAAVGGSGHRLLGTNRSAGGAIAAALNN